jgi:hypothetical protein
MSMGMVLVSLDPASRDLAFSARMWGELALQLLSFIGL